MRALDYQTPPEIPIKLTLKAMEDSVELIWPPMPIWRRLYMVIGVAMAVITMIGQEIWLLWMIWNFRTKSGVRLPFFNGWVEALGILQALAVVGALVYLLLREARWGYLPKRLFLSKDQMIWTDPQMRGMKNLIFAADEITDVSVENVRELFRKNRLYKLRFRFNSRRPIIRSFRTPDPNLPEEIASSFRRILKL